MKTLARPRDRAELVRRLGTVRPDSVRKWGRMSPHQMVCHVSDSFRMAAGLKTASDASGVMQRTVLKWIVLWAPLRWPAGILTRPEMDQELGGTRPGDFGTDVAELEALIGRVAALPGGFEWPAHPIFGHMSQQAWLRWGYLHTDHHLRQFGA